jgi:hypothetical protein
MQRSDVCGSIVRPPCPPEFLVTPRAEVQNTAATSREKWWTGSSVGRSDPGRFSRGSYCLRFALTIPKIRVVIVEIPVPGHPRPLIRVDQPFSDDSRVVSSDS